MRVIGSKLHGVLDYLMGFVLILSPWLFGFADGGAAQWIPVAVGALALIVSLVTDYEYSLSRVVPLGVHLGNDVGSGLFLAISPWLFNFDEFVWVPHVIFGLLMVGSGLLTNTVPDYKRGYAGERSVAS